MPGIHDALHYGPIITHCVMTVKFYLAENQGSVKVAGCAMLLAECLAMLEARDLAIPREHCYLVDFSPELRAGTEIRASVSGDGWLLSCC